MFWPVLTLVALAALFAVYWHGRTKLRQAQRAAGEAIERIEENRRREVLEARAQQEALLDSMVEGVLLLDENGRIEMANRALKSLFGIAGELRSLTILEAFRQHELVELAESIQAGTAVMSRELHLLRPERVVEVNAGGIFDGTGRKQGTILVFHDLTGLKKLERNREEFVANVSHELRTPLSMIKGYAETLLDGAKDDPEVAKKFLETIDRNAERLRLLMDDLLTISELESGRVKLNLQPVALRVLAEKVMADFRGRAEARETRLVCQIPDLEVSGDPDRLEQVLGNLVDNAIKYGRPHGCVRLEARPLGDGTVQISVHDDGQGIPPEALERVFERFYRVDKGRSREQGGTGLGLSIVKHIVQSHGGKAWASNQPGHGATFSFTLRAVV